MNLERIREAEKYIDEDWVERYEFTEIFKDFLLLA